MLHDGTTAPIMTQAEIATKFAEQAPDSPAAGFDPTAGFPQESKPFPWMWLGIGLGAAVLVWYFFLRKK